MSKRWAKLLPLGTNSVPVVYVGMFDPDAAGDPWGDVYRRQGWVNPDERGNVWSRPGGGPAYVGCWGTSARDDAAEYARQAEWAESMGRTAEAERAWANAQAASDALLVLTFDRR